MSVLKNTSPKLIVFSAAVIILLIVAALAPLIVPHDPYAQDLSQALLNPNSAHLLGTDRFGRDIFARVLMGAQTSIYSTLVLVFFTSVIGIFVGVAAAWFGGIIDSLLMRTSDVFLAFPALIFAIAVAAVLGGGIQNAILALVAISWPKYARIARSLSLEQKGELYISAAKVGGASDFQIIFIEILPNIIGPLLVTSVLDIGTMMMELAALSFLGLGAQPPIAEWGSMMSDNRNLLQIAPWTVFGPGLAIFICIAIFNLFGDSLRDRIDPKRRKK